MIEFALELCHFFLHFFIIYIKKRNPAIVKKISKHVYFDCEASHMTTFRILLAK